MELRFDPAEVSGRYWYLWLPAGWLERTGAAAPGGLCKMTKAARRLSDGKHAH